MQNPTEETLLAAVKSLIAIQSTADNPAGLSAAYEYIRNLVLECDKDITIEEFTRGGKPSFLAYRGQTRPEKFSLILNAHVDVVPGKPEQYDMTITDNRIYGRGTFDMKAAAIVLTQVFCEYVDRIPYAFGLQIVTDEESSGQDGTLYQIEQGVRSDFVICGEAGRSTTQHEIANESKGVVKVEVTFSGKSAHAAYPWKGDNAATKAASFVQLLHDRYPVPSKEHDDTTVTVTAIHTNSEASNKVSDAATISIDARYVAGDPHFANHRAFEDLIHAIDPEATVMRYIDFTAPLYTDPHNPLLLELKAAAEAAEGTAFSFVRRHGASDGRFYGAIGNPACEFGIAGEAHHGDGEYITLEAFRNYLDTMRIFLGKTISGWQRTK